jgi:hypothetical protein
LQDRWDELKDYANASRLFATDPHSSVIVEGDGLHPAVGVGGEQPRHVGVVLQLIPAILQASVKAAVWFGRRRRARPRQGERASASAAGRPPQRTAPLTMHSSQTGTRFLKA